MVVAHNLMAMNAQRQYNITGLNKKKSTEKLSSGYRINRAGDDAAGLAISEKMRKQISGLDRGTDNMQDGVSWVQIGDGAMAEVHDILQRMTELSVQGANGTLSPEDRQAIDKEIQQLKVEINRINETTKFNDKRIFSTDNRALDDNGKFIIRKLEGNPTDLKIFDATYDDATGDVTYGGIVFDGNRISWDAIDSNMVYVDGGTQKFHEGTWMYMDANGRKLTFSAKEGDEVPSITRSFDVTANLDGLLIDGDLIKWEDIKSQSGNSISTMADGFLNEKNWTADYHGAKLSFAVERAFKGIEGLVDAINEGAENHSYRLYAVYAGSSEVQAVDADIDNKRFEIRSTAVAQNVVSGNGYTLRAGDGTSGYDGLWLEDGNGNEVNGSYRSWADMGITSWDSGSDIQSTIHYMYSDKDGVNDTKIEFDYTLSDITSKDSVIDGLDGVQLSFDNVNAVYGMALTKDPAYTNVLSADIVWQDIDISLQNELDLGRDFDIKEQSVGNESWDTSMRYHPRLMYEDGSGNGIITYYGSASSAVAHMGRDLSAYEDSLISTKIMQTLAGIPNSLNLGPKSINDLLGPTNVSAQGYMSEKVTLTNTMDCTQKLVPGKEYNCSKLDFSGVGTDYNIWELVGSGFYADCATCTTHYNIKFVFDTPQSGSGEIDGVRYRLDTSKGTVGSHSGSPALEISVSSLVENGLTSGNDIASSIMKAVKACGFDDHLQQYMVDGSKFYICDYRTYKEGYFDPNVSVPETKANYTMDYSSSDNGFFEIQYQYDYADYRDRIQVNMINDSAGEYVKSGDLYVKYDAALHSGWQRYNIQVSYSDVPGGTANDSTMGTRTIKMNDGSSLNVQTLGNHTSMKGNYIEKAISDMIQASSLDLQSKDYTKADIFGDENPNVAIKSLFDAYSATPNEPTRHGVIKYEESIMILKSGDASNKLIIPRFSLNTAALGLNRANCVTQNSSRNTIDMINRALEHLNERRSLFGALQNRMEHAIRSNENTEENTTAADSRIRDTDMAEEMVNFSKNSILEQAGQAMLAQANQINQGVLSLLQ